MSTHFDNVAESYHISLPKMPFKYIQLINDSFALTVEDKLIDLGCGSGQLAIALSKVSNHVQGIDSSKEMIRIAKSFDTQRSVTWICSPVEQFNFGYNIYKLIISFESFHLFPNLNDLFNKCVFGLKNGGFLCLGWCNFFWEQILKDTIIDVFAEFGIEWGQWGYQSCTNISDIVNHNMKGLSYITFKSILTETKTNIQQIALYLSTIDKTADLQNKTRMMLTRNLEIKFRKILQSEEIAGDSLYYLAFCTKYN